MGQNDIKKYQPQLADTARLWRKLLYSKIENIFTYENVPEEIPQRFFNLALFKTGKLVFYKIGEKYTVQPFSYNDILNWYYVPAKGRVVNPYLPKAHQNWEFTIDNEAVIYNSTPDIYNIRGFSIVADLVFKTANQLAENDISYYAIQRNHRLLAIFTAQSDQQKREFDKILEKIYNGEVDITMQEDLVSHINVNPIAMNSTRSSITELIEFAQYILANFYHSFGINSNYNLKREQLNSNEIDVNKEVLQLNINDLLQTRKDGVEKINKKYGLNISVSLNEEVYQSLLQEAEGNIDPEKALYERKSKLNQIYGLSINNESEENINGRTKIEENNKTEKNRNSDGTDSKSDSDTGDDSKSGSNNTDEPASRRSKTSDNPDKEGTRSTDNASGEEHTSEVGREDASKESQDDKSDSDRPTHNEHGNERDSSSEQDSGTSETSDMGLNNSSSPSETGNGDNNIPNGITININVGSDSEVSVDANSDQIGTISEDNTSNKSNDQQVDQQVDQSDEKEEKE